MGFKTESAKPHTPFASAKLTTDSYESMMQRQLANGMSPLVGVRVMMRTCIKQASSPSAPTTVECVFVSSSSDRSAVET